MKKVFLILLLLYAKNLSAQQLYLGGSCGGSVYNFRQIPASPILDLNWGLCAQYTFKNTDFGYEGNFVWDMFGPNQSNVANPAPCFTVINYLFFSPLYGTAYVPIQFKAGFFYSHYFIQNINSCNDFGPAVAISLSFKLSKKSYLGLELSKMYGLSKYYARVSEDVPLGVYYANPDKYNQLGYSNITYTSLSLKFVYKIDKRSAKLKK